MSIRFLIPALISLLILLNINNSFAAQSTANVKSIEGYWLTWDKKTHKPSSVIKIWLQNGKYFGRIYKIVSTNVKDPVTHCTKCKGNQKNKPILGLIIIRDMIYKGGKYVDGRILDPRDGKEYHATMWLVNGGKEVKLRGYIGLPIFGQTRVWSHLTESQVLSIKGTTAK